MTDVFSGFLFAGFVGAAVLAVWLSQNESQRQTGICLFLAYTMFASTAAGLLHREFWPFSRWQLFAYRYKAPIEALHIRAIDAGGTEYDVDRRAWEPLSGLVLHTWLLKHLLSLKPAQQGAIGHYLLRMANEARERAAVGRSVGVFERFFGPLSAPLHVVNSRSWSAPGSVPSASFTGIRMYLDRWDVTERAQDPQQLQRTLFYEYHCR